MDQDFPDGARSVFARAVSAEVRAAMAVRRMTIRAFATGAGFSSHNYLAIRLRDEKPFTLDDIDMICRYLDEDPVAFMKRAYDLHSEAIWVESMDARKARRLWSSTAAWMKT